jgi:hypothetical protein
MTLASTEAQEANTTSKAKTKNFIILSLWR